ncbi:MAG: phage major capsid protein [Pseudomonadota bacterium]
MKISKILLSALAVGLSVFANSAFASDMSAGIQVIGQAMSPGVMAHAVSSALGSLASVSPAGVIRGIQSVRADMTDPKAVLAELQNAWHQFKAENDKQMADIRKGINDPLQASKVDSINAALTTMQNQMSDLAVKAAAWEMGGGGGVDPAISAHSSAFNAFFRRGTEAGLRDLEVNARLSTQSDPDGGFVVPHEMETAIDRVLGTMSAMRSLATVRPIGAASYKKLINQGGTSSGWVGENGSRGEGNTPRLAGLDFPVMELFAQPGATQTMLDDSSMNIESWLADEVAVEFSEQEGEAFITGNGVAKPRGLVSYDTIANANYAWGKVGFIKSGAAADFAAADPLGYFIDLIHALKRGYRQNAAFLLNDLTVSKVRKFKDSEGNYMWQPSVVAGIPPTLFGYRAETDDNMPDVAANAMAVAFGDFKRAYLIVDRVGIRVLRDPFTAKPNVLFYTTKRVGGGIQNFEAVKFMKIAA